jgi:hypothetical protein
MILREIGSYTITSEKVDNLNPWWVDLLAISIFVIIISSVITTMVFFGTAYSLFICMAILIVGVFSYLEISRRYLKCGVRIRLANGKNFVEYKTFIISGNSEKDAARIKTAVDEFETLAKTLSEENSKRLKMENELKELEQIKKKESCNLYDSVMSKVK